MGSLKNWLIQDDNQTLFNGIIPDQKITISIMVGNSLETSKRFILQRYLSPGYRARTKRNDFMSLCNGKSNSLWWNAMVGGCPEWSDRKWCFLRLSDLEKAYSTSYYDDCFFSNRFNVAAHPNTAICHAMKI